MLKLKLIPPKQEEPIYRATVHKTGKIGLAIDTAKKFGLFTNKAVELGINEADPTDTSIYGITRNAGEPNTYKIMKAGDYHSINAKSFFDTIGLDYEKSYIAYVVKEIMVEGQGGVMKFERVSTKTEPTPVVTGMVVL